MAWKGATPTTCRILRFVDEFIQLGEIILDFRHTGLIRALWPQSIIDGWTTGLLGSHLLNLSILLQGKFIIICDIVKFLLCEVYPRF